MSHLKIDRRCSHFLGSEIDEFLLDRQSRNYTAATMGWYRRCLAKWQEFCLGLDVQCTEDVTASHVRRFLVYLAETHSRGGVVTIYTGVRAFLKWYADEYEPADWHPLAKVKAPKRPKDRVKPLILDDFQQLLDNCIPKTFEGNRDRAFLYFLLDTGLRHQEATDLLVSDVNLQTGQVLVRQGKGQKTRVVFIGSKTRRAFLVYYRYRESLDDDEPLWITAMGRQLSKSGLRQIVRRCAQRAGIPEPGMHSFRRAFALNSLRNGMDVVSLQRLMGHADLSVIDRYLALLDEDLQRAHKRHGVVDNMK